MRTRLAGLTAITAIAALALTACGGDSDPETTPTGSSPTGGSSPTETATDDEFPAGSTMAAFNEAGSITIGTKFDQPLFGLVAPDGTPEGFDVEIGKIIADELGIPEDGITRVETVSSNREPYLQNGQVDLVIATYTMNEARKEVVDFAGPYYNAGQSLLVTTDNTTVTGEESLGADVTLCSVEGSTPAEYIRTNHPDVQLELFGAYSDCLEPLRNGQVDAITTDNVILAGYAAAEPDAFMVVGDQFTEEPYGIGLPKDQDDFRDWMNDLLEEIFADGRWEAAWDATAGVALPTPPTPTLDRY